MRHIPNILSALRILMVGVFIYFFTKAQYFACLITYITAFLTDLLDGFLARRNHWISNVGKVLDPLADKLMLLTALVCFATRGWLPLYMILIVFVKELIMIIGGAILTGLESWLLVFLMPALHLRWQNDFSRRSACWISSCWLLQSFLRSSRLYTTLKYRCFHA